MTVLQAIAQASTHIARRDAEVLLLHIVGHDRAWLMAHPEALLEPDQTERLLEAVSKRKQHWPLQYLTGWQEFFGLQLQVTPDVLIPRPETELLVEAVLDWAALHHRTEWMIADVGTGSGAIALALAASLPSASIRALDASTRVRAIFEANSSRLGLAQRVHFMESDLLQALQPETVAGARLDVVVSNPPYVPLADATSLQPEVREFEPHLALFAGEDGLEIYRRLIPEAAAALRPGGLLAMEFGFGQREALKQLLSGWSKVQFLDDYAGIPRIALAERGTT